MLQKQHYQTALARFEQFGVNLVQLRLDPAWGVISPVDGNEMFRFNHDDATVKRMKNYLKRAEEVYLLLKDRYNFDEERYENSRHNRRIQSVS